MTNLEHWRFYLKDVPSPDTWVDLGWYFCVAAALQRRVWYGNLLKGPLFPNFYSVLIGPPACGKGLVIRPVTNILRYWKHNPAEQETEEPQGVEHKRILAHGPDSITFQKLTQEMSAATRRFDYLDENGDSKIYTHASMYNALEEFNSFVRRGEDQLPKFLLQAYDCGDYSYKTKHNQSDLIRKMCYSLVAGATPALLLEAQKFHIFDDGFTSRIIFSFEDKPRHNKFFIFEEDDNINKAQLESFGVCLEWIRNLTTLFGRVQYTDEAKEYLADWFETEHQKIVAQAGPKMNNYYGRTRVHVQKMAMGMHFSESTEMLIGVESFRRAIQFLQPIEQKMAIGFSLIGRNELHPVAQQILKFVRANGGCSEADIFGNFMSEIHIDELRDIITGFQFTQKLRLTQNGFYAV